jgi:hypothetical protein
MTCRKKNRKRAHNEPFAFQASHLVVLVAIAGVLWLRLGYVQQTSDIVNTPLIVTEPSVRTQPAMPVQEAPRELSDFAKDQQNAHIAKKLVEENYKLDPEKSFASDYSSIEGSRYANNYTFVNSPKTGSGFTLK